jgi:hypothetical protein
MLINMEKQNTVRKIVFEVRWNSVLYVSISVVLASVPGEEILLSLLSRHKLPREPHSFLFSRYVGARQPKHIA